MSLNMIGMNSLMTLPPSSGGAKASQQGQDSLFQIPGATPGVQDHSALSSESQGAQKLEAGLDQMLERFVEDLQKKTSL